MPIEVTEIKTNKSFSMNSKDYQERRATAFQAGTVDHSFTPKYTFEAEAYMAGTEQAARIRDEMQKGVR